MKSANLSFKNNKVAIIHYWLVTWRGGEKVIEQLLKLYPDADLYCHVVDSAVYEKHLGSVHEGQLFTSFIQKFPKATRWYQKYLPFMPYAQEQYDLTAYDVVISSESGPSKGVITRPDALHVCYCHSPMRYVWDLYHEYRKSAGRLTRWLMGPVIHYLKIWDRLSADRVDHFICNSNYVASRVNKFYRRDSFVIYPPVALDDFEVREDKDDFYLVLGQLTHYKKADIAFDAFLNNAKKLIIIGEGELFKPLHSRCPENITLLGKVDFSALKDYLSRAKALIFPGVEDFGIVPLEAMACGTPVLAFSEGGALETVIDGETGLFFTEQSAESINECVTRFEQSQPFCPKIMRLRAEQFSEDVFQSSLKSLMDDLLAS